MINTTLFNPTILRYLNVRQTAAALFFFVLLGFYISTGTIEARIGQLKVPNNDFSDPSNEASISGGVIAGPTTQLLGNGPWSATSTGALKLLARPTASIGDGSASVSGLASISVIDGVSNNSATFFNDDIGHTFISGRTYTLEVHLRTASLLSVNALTNSGVGVALLADGAEVANSSGNPNISLRLLNDTTGVLTVIYEATTADDGKPIGISLFTGEGSGLLDVSLLGTVRFDEVALSMTQTFGEWAELHIEDETQRDPFANPSGDGISNLAKYALNLDPNSSDRGKLPQGTVESDGGNRYLTLNVARDTNAFEANLVVEVSEDLVNWTSGPEHTTVLVDEPLELVIRDNVALDDPDRRFIRVRVDLVD